MNTKVSKKVVRQFFNRPLKALIHEAAEIHKANHADNKIQVSSLLSIKTGGCPENCSYCPQSAHHQTSVSKQPLMSIDQVKRSAQNAKKNGATRFCMGTAWRNVTDGPEFERVLEMVKTVKSLDVEVCCTLGMVNLEQAHKLKLAGLTAYNHNIDTSRRYYSKIISTRNYDDRLHTIANVRKAGINVCTGGIIGMGETNQDRIDFIWQLASFSPQPESVTINSLIPIQGTPLQKQKSATAIELARVIATTRCLLPQSMIRLSAGRKAMSEEGQFLCFLAGANSIFLGDTLLTASNPSIETDKQQMDRMGLSPLRN